MEKRENFKETDETDDWDLRKIWRRIRYDTILRKVICLRFTEWLTGAIELSMDQLA